MKRGFILDNKIKIGFIGAGNMGFAIMKGIAGSSTASNTELYAYDPNSDQVERLSEFGVSACKSEKEILEKCKYVFLAVKPQVIETVLETAAPFTTPDTVFVSIAAGISVEFIVSKTIPEAKVILVMPNTPLLLGEGASALSHNNMVTDEEFNIILNIFNVCGKAAVLPLDKMKEIIAINGSSPAFIYLFAKGFMEYAEKEGIASETALSLFAQTLIGSAKMLTDSGYTVDELIRMVSSPGGTTLAGLDAFYEGKLTDIVGDACERCTKRAYELSK